MKWFKRLFRKWSKEAWEFKEDETSTSRPLIARRVNPNPIDSSLHIDSALQTTYRLAVIPALNGRIIEIANYKRNNNGPDWLSSFYVMGADEKISEALEKIILMKELETK